MENNFSHKIQVHIEALYAYKKYPEEKWKSLIEFFMSLHPRNQYSCITFDTMNPRVVELSSYMGAIKSFEQYKITL